MKHLVLAVLVVGTFVFAAAPAAEAASCQVGGNPTGAIAGGFADFDEAHVYVGPKSVHCYYPGLP